MEIQPKSLQAMRLDVSHGEGEARVTRNFIVADLPPVQKVNTNSAQPAELIVILDCSGSMTGTRIALATGILEILLQNPLVAKVQVVKFGSTVQDPLHYEKTQVGEILKIKADLGGTVFDLPMKKLIQILETKSTFRRAAMFFSDGEATNPEALYAPLQAALEKSDCPLLSVAVTTAAQPELMIRLSKLYGETDLVLLRQDDTVENGVLLVEDKMSLGSSLMEGNLQIVTNTETGPLVVPFRFREGQDKIFLSYDSPKKCDRSLDKLSIKIEGTEKELELKSLSDVPSGEKRLGAVNEILTYLSKDFISKFVTKNIEQSNAMQMIKQLRAVVQACAISNTFFTDIETLKVQEPGKATRAQILLKQKELRKNSHQLSQKLNILESVIGGGDLRAALEAYSAKTVSHKFNRRAMQIAQKNADNQKSEEIPMNLVKAIMESCPSQKNKETPECILWCISHIGTAMESLSGAATGLPCKDLDWVGRGCLVVPGKVAALNPWAVRSIVPRPVNISNQSVGYVKIASQKDGRRLAEIKGLSLGEFNCSVPFVHPQENLVLARLSLSLLRSTNFGSRSFSDLFCGSPDLYTPNQVFALYTTCAISAFEKGANSVNFEDCVRAVMTLWDLAYFSPFDKAADSANNKVLKGTSKSFKYISETLDRMIADPDTFISSKEDINSPHINRVIYLLIVGLPYLQSVFDTREKLDAFLTSVFYRLTLRHIVDNTSARFKLKDIAGFDKDPFMKKVMHFIQEGIVNNDPIEGSFAPDASALLPKLGLFRLYIVKAFLGSLIDFKDSSGCKDFRELHFSLLSEKTPISQFVEALKSAQAVYKSGEDNQHLFALLGTSEAQIIAEKRDFIKGVTITTPVSSKDLMNNILIAALRRHLEESETQPKHDSSFNATFFKTYPSWNCFFQNSVYTALSGLKNKMRGKAESELTECARLLMLNKRIINRVEHHRKVSRIERLCHPYQTDSLSYTGKDVPKFKSRRGMFQFVAYDGYTDEILAEMRKYGLHNIKDLDVQKLLHEGSQYVHGFSLFSSKRLESSKTYAEFETGILEDLKSHYKKKRTESPLPYPFNEPRINNIKVICFQVYNDTQIYKFLKAQESQDVEALYKSVLAQFPDCLTWNGYDKAIREDHLKELCEAKKEKKYPVFEAVE